MSKEKPYWTKKQVNKAKKYLQSKECADNFNNMNEKWKEDEWKQRQEDIEWWMRIKDEPFTI